MPDLPFDPDDEDGFFGPTIRRFFPPVEEPEYDEDDDEQEWWPPYAKAA